MRTILLIRFFVVLCATAAASVHGGNMLKKHVHTGFFKPFDGKQMPYRLSLAQNELLNKGEPVIVDALNETPGTSRGMVIQDIAAPPSVCLENIRNIDDYPKMVPKVKKTRVYNHTVHTNGTSHSGIEFVVGIPLFTLSYYLMLVDNPMHSTISWTLDYRYSSDFDDIVGQWQVMPHPTKAGWTRLLYTCEIRLFPWIPEFVSAFFTESSLLEATEWVKVQSESQIGMSASPVSAIAVSGNGKEIEQQINDYWLGSLNFSECFHHVTNEAAAAAAAVIDGEGVLEPFPDFTDTQQPHSDRLGKIDAEDTRGTSAKKETQADHHDHHSRNNDDVPEGYASYSTHCAEEAALKWTERATMYLTGTPTSSASTSTHPTTFITAAAAAEVADMILGDLIEEPLVTETSSGSDILSGNIHRGFLIKPNQNEDVGDLTAGPQTATASTSTEGSEDAPNATRFVDENEGGDEIEDGQVVIIMQSADALSSSSLSAAHDSSPSAVTLTSTTPSIIGREISVSEDTKETKEPVSVAVVDEDDALSTTARADRSSSARTIETPDKDSHPNSVQETREVEEDAGVLYEYNDFVGELQREEGKQDSPSVEPIILGSTKDIESKHEITISGTDSTIVSVATTTIIPSSSSSSSLSQFKRIIRKGTIGARCVKSSISRAVAQLVALFHGAMLSPLGKSFSSYISTLFQLTRTQLTKLMQGVHTLLLPTLHLPRWPEKVTQLYSDIHTALSRARGRVVGALRVVREKHVRAVAILRQNMQSGREKVTLLVHGVANTGYEVTSGLRSIWNQVNGRVLVVWHSFNALLTRLGIKRAFEKV